MSGEQRGEREPGSKERVPRSDIYIYIYTGTYKKRFLDAFSCKDDTTKVVKTLCGTVECDI